ncbi:MAG: hypothetical protein ACRELB_01720, partial [Polyangiaceae bacterium]
LTESIRSGPTALTTPGTPDHVTFFDADAGHIGVFLSRHVMLRAMLGFSFPLSSGCKIADTCGRFSGTASLDITGGLLWNFDTSPGDH